MKNSQSILRACVIATILAVAVVIVNFSISSSRSHQPASLLVQDKYSDQYQLANLLNLPSYAGIGDQNGSSIHKAASKVAKQFPNSILSRYRAFPSVCATQPFRPYLRQAVDSYADDHRSLTNYSLIEADDSLLVHIDFNRNEHRTILSKHLLYAVNELSINFKRIVLLLPSNDINDKLSIRQGIEQSISKDSKSVPEIEVIYSENEDDAVVKMAHASHLLIHTGPTSALGALVNTHKVYYTPLIDDYMQNNRFRWLLNNATRIPLPQRVHRPELNLMGPVVPSCCKLDSFGVGDSEKVVCSNAASFQTNECWIMSVGCNGLWGFEEAIVERTGCKVHTFDCTGTWNVPKKLQGRVFFHKLCLGDKNETRPVKREGIGQFQPIRDLIEIGSRESGFDGIVLPSLAKMDIEGFEYMALRTMLEQEDKSLVPEQLALEIHVQITTSLDMFVPYQKRHGRQYYIVKEDEMIQFFEYLSSHGYELVYRSNNPYCRHCSEITMVKRHALPASK